MNMTIIMYMNIYISKANEGWLRNQDRTMSGIINGLLDKERGASSLQVAKEGFQEALDDWPKAGQTIPVENMREAQAPITKRNKDMDFCKHGAVKGFCKKGCK